MRAFPMFKLPVGTSKADHCHLIQTIKMKGIVEDIKTLYKRSVSAVLLDNQSNTFFFMMISPVLFNILLENITRETFHDHHDLHCHLWETHRRHYWRHQQRRSRPYHQTDRQYEWFWSGEKILTNSKSTATTKRDLHERSGVHLEEV